MGFLMTSRSFEALRNRQRKRQFFFPNDLTLFRESTNRQIRSPGDSLPPSRQTKKNGMNLLMQLFSYSGRSEANFHQGKGVNKGEEELSR